MVYRIGCSGYYYPQWKQKVYPAGLAPKNWLGYYSSIFNTVELNGTFYRQPKVTDLKKYASGTPDDFTFSVKMSRYITHVQRLREKQTIQEFQDRILSGLGAKLQHFLFQMPPNFHFNAENLGHVIEGIPHHPRNVVEFRHISWWNDETAEALKKAKITFCNIDFPGIDSWFIHTTRYFYMRMHGNPELFKTPYTEQRIHDVYHQFPKSAKVCSTYFNNTWSEAGFENARTLQEMTAVVA